jgi:menaquinone-dependent protoporphyrinogen IX oxidase
MKGIIVYKSKYGATRQYAEWAGEELGLKVVTPEGMGPEELNGCDFVVIGGSVYIGKLLIRKWIRRYKDTLQHKKLFLFVVCGTSASEKEKQEWIIKKNIPGPLLDRFAIFFLPGRVVRKQLSGKDRIIVALGARLEKDPVKREVRSRDIDGVKKGCLGDMIGKIRDFCL